MRTKRITLSMRVIMYMVAVVMTVTLVPQLGLATGEKGMQPSAPTIGVPAEDPNHGKFTPATNHLTTKYLKYWRGTITNLAGKGVRVVRPKPIQMSIRFPSNYIYKRGIQTPENGGT